MVTYLTWFLAAMDHIIEYTSNFPSFNITHMFLKMTVSILVLYSRCIVVVATIVSFLYSDLIKWAYLRWMC